MHFKRQYIKEQYITNQFLDSCLGVDALAIFQVTFKWSLV